MFVNDEVIKRLYNTYGVPETLRLNYPTPKAHFDFIRSTQKNNRSHDVTLYLYDGDRLAVTRKPMYPPGAFRPPSGGINPGESFKAGAVREGMEELGVPIDLEKYLLKVRVDFVCGTERIEWTSHIFQVSYIGKGKPKLNPTDRHEIVEAVWANKAEFFGVMRKGLLSVGSTGLLYRVHLHDAMWRIFGWGAVKQIAPPR